MKERGKGVLMEWDMRRGWKQPINTTTNENFTAPVVCLKCQGAWSRCFDSPLPPAKKKTLNAEVHSQPVHKLTGSFLADL